MKKFRIFKIFLTTIVIFIFFEIFFIFFCKSITLENFINEHFHTLNFSYADDLAIKGDILTQSNTSYITLTIVSKNHLPFSQNNWTLFSPPDLAIESFENTKYGFSENSNPISTFSHPNIAYFEYLYWENSTNFIPNFFATNLKFKYKKTDEKKHDHVEFNLFINKQSYTITIYQKGGKNYLTLNKNF